MSKDTEAISGVFDEFCAAVEAGDSSRWLKVFATGAQYQAPDESMLNGKAAMKAWAKKRIEPFQMRYDFARLKDVEVAGTLAVGRTEFRIGYTLRTGGKAVKTTGKAEFVFKKQAAGAWKVARVTFNWDAPIPAGSAPSEADAVGIAAVVREYQDAVEAGDLARWVKVNTDDVIYMAPDQPLVTGKAAIRKWAKEGWFDPFTMKYDYVRTKDIEVSGAMAVARTEFTIRAKPKAGGKGLKGVGKADVVLRRQSDGSWKIARQTFNWDAPLAPPK